MNESRAYNLVPRYPCAEGEVAAGWQSLCADLPSRGHVLAIDGPQIANWDRIAAAVADELTRRGTEVAVLDDRDHMASWEQSASARRRPRRWRATPTSPRSPAAPSPTSSTRCLRRRGLTAWSW